MNVRFVVLVAIVMPHLIIGTTPADNALRGYLVIAAKQGDFAKAQQFIQAGVNINDADEDGKSLLLYCCGPLRAVISRSFKC